MSRKTFVNRIHKAMQARVSANLAIGCLETVTLTVPTAELYSGLKVTKLHLTTLNGVAGDLVAKGYRARYVQTSASIEVSYDPAEDYLNFNSLEDLEESVAE